MDRQQMNRQTDSWVDDPKT